MLVKQTLIRGWSDFCFRLYTQIITVSRQTDFRYIFTNSRPPNRRTRACWL